MDIRSRPKGWPASVGGIKLSRTGRREGSPAPTQNYSPGDTGINTPPEPDDYFGDSGHRPGGDNPGDGDDDGTMTAMITIRLQGITGMTERNPIRIRRRVYNPPGSGPPDDDGDDDPKSDDSDENSDER